ncbi:MAG: hypothetical protein ACXAC7_09700 [Candidatus Hodarchaeales archaeon]|jgi:hypothetical protein
MKDVKIKLSGLWIAHFLIWSFGDIVRLLTPGYIEDTAVTNETQIIASIIGMMQALMIVLSLILEDKPNRWANLVLGGVFTLINIGWMVEILIDQQPVWEILLTIVYLTFNAMIIWYAYKWSVEENELTM